MVQQMKNFATSLAYHCAMAGLGNLGRRETVAFRVRENVSGLSARSAFACTMPKVSNSGFRPG